MARLEVKTQPRSNMRDREDLRSVERAEAYVHKALEAVSATGFWLAKATDKITWNDPRRRFRVKSINDQRRCLVVKVKPGDNGSAWEYDLIAPQNMDVTELNRIYSMLRDVHIGDEIKHRAVGPPKLEEPLPDLNQGKMYMPVDDGSPVLRPCDRCGEDVDVGFKNRHYETADHRRFCGCEERARNDAARARLEEKRGIEFVSDKADRQVAGTIRPPGKYTLDVETGKATPGWTQTPQAPSNDKAISVMSRLATIIQRVKARDDQKRQVKEKLEQAERDCEDLLKEVQDLTQMLTHIGQEEADDKEAEAAKGMLSLMEGALD